MSLLVLVPNVLAVNPELPVQNVQELIDLAKTQPLAYASSGNGTPLHLSGELFKAMAGVDITHIPYKGSGPALTDVLGRSAALIEEHRTVTQLLALVRGGGENRLKMPLTSYVLAGRLEEVLYDGVTDGELIARIPTERLVRSLVRNCCAGQAKAPQSLRRRISVEITEIESRW